MKHIHILGICGTFMGGLAALAREAGFRVTGCDSGVYPPMSDQLRTLGIDLIEGFSADQLALKPDIFVIGNVVSRARLSDGSPKFPLMEAILNSGARYTSGPQWLSEHVLHNRHVLAVAGTHGKTTTSSMLAWILECAGFNPGFLIGGVPLDFGVSARLGNHHFVIEADEYDTAFFDKRSKFVHYRPKTAVLNNLEFDHADIFNHLSDIERQFHHLVRTVPSSGRIIFNELEESLARVLAQGCWSEQRSFGTLVSDFSAQGQAHDFVVTHRKQTQTARVSWSLNGLHNQLNALAAMAAAEHVGVSLEASAKALSSFQNVKRRMELRGCINNMCVYDDFAHHPTAIRTTLDGLRAQLDANGETSKRIIALLEPRSNTMKLGTMKSQLSWSLEAADLVFCHTAGLDWNVQEALSDWKPARLSDPNSEHEIKAKSAPDIDSLLQQLKPLLRSGDQIVCMSNGGFGGIHQRLLQMLKA